MDRTIVAEVCPISNYLLGYYNPKENPFRNVDIHNSKMQYVICSDDNGIFNYSTVTKDYVIVYKFWKLNIADLKKIITNGLYLIDKKYRYYYLHLFYHLWEKYNLETTNLNF